MKYFKMGEEVIINALLKPVYKNKVRTWERFKIKERKAFYTGIAYKQEGNWTDYPHAHLKDIKAIKVLRVKFNGRGNEKFTLPQDVRRKSDDN